MVIKSFLMTEYSAPPVCHLYYACPCLMTMCLVRLVYYTNELKCFWKMLLTSFESNEYCFEAIIRLSFFSLLSMYSIWLWKIANGNIKNDIHLFLMKIMISCLFFLLFYSCYIAIYIVLSPHHPLSQTPKILI